MVAPDSDLHQGLLNCELLVWLVLLMKNPVLYCRFEDLRVKLCLHLEEIVICVAIFVVTRMVVLAILDFSNHGLYSALEQGG